MHNMGGLRAIRSAIISGQYDQYSLPRYMTLIHSCADIRIGFQNASYTFTEPEFETEISGVVFLEKEGGQLTEQTYLVAIDITMTNT